MEDSYVYTLRKISPKGEYDKGNNSLLIIPRYPFTLILVPVPSSLVGTTPSSITESPLFLVPTEQLSTTCPRRRSWYR